MNEKIITLDGVRWKLVVNESKQLAFAIEIPDRLSTWKNDPFWFSWDDNHPANLPEWSSTFTSKEIGISPFKIKSFLMNHITSFINELHLDFFYFSPTSEKRGDIYTSLMEQFASKLKGSWIPQILNDYWFYFTKENKD